MTKKMQELWEALLAAHKQRWELDNVPDVRNIYTDREYQEEQERLDHQIRVAWTDIKIESLKRKEKRNDT